CGNSLNEFFCPHCTCEFCENDAHVGYNCPAQVPSFQTLPSFPQQYPCCEDCGVLPEADHCQPPQYTVNHPIFNAHNDLLGSGTTHMDQMEQLTSMCEMFCQFIQKKQEEKRIEEEQAAKAQNSKVPVCYDDDDDYNSAITPNEPVDSLSMGDEHLDTIPVTKSDEFIKSCVETFVPNPSESEGEYECDVPAGFTTFSNILFDADYDFNSGDDQSFFDEDFPKKIYSNPLFDEEIISMKIEPHSFNAESDLIESKLNHDSSIIISSKIDSLFDEFAEEIVSDNSNADIESFSPSPIPNEDSDSRMEEIDLSLNPDDPMPSSIEDDDHDSERDVPILKELLDNYSLSLHENESYHFDIPSPYRPPAKPPDGKTGTLNIKMMGDVSDQKGLEIFQPSVECPMMINGKNTPVLDVPLFHFYPLGQLKYGGISNDSLSLLENESFHFDIPSSSRPPTKPPDGSSGILNVKVMGDISKHKVPMPRLMFTHSTLVPNQEKSPDLLSHQGHEAFQPSTECPMMIYGKNTPILDVLFF
nr:hypothetical protein [Tanacetum cinerariifolium]